LIQKVHPRLRRAETDVHVGIARRFTETHIGRGGAGGNGPSKVDASDSPHAVERPPQLCSRVTNGCTVFAIGGDGRGALTRRWKDLVESHTNDCGGASAQTQPTSTLEAAGRASDPEAQAAGAKSLRARLPLR
jgi:hypothetical protein